MCEGPQRSLCAACLYKCKTSQIKLLGYANEVDMVIRGVQSDN